MALRRRPRSAPARWCLVASLLAAVLFSACGASRSYRAQPGVYDLLPDAERVPLRGARQALESGDLARAAAYLEPVAARHPRNLGVRSFLQELELAQLAAGQPLDDIEPLVDPADAERVLRERYVADARSSASPELWVLAARLEDDGGRALDYLERAEALDPGCVWVHYGRAWWSFRLRRFQDARLAMDQALALDPGHGRSMRLFARMLAGSGDGPEATRVLALWLERAEPDPLIASNERAAATVDLALLYVLADKPRKALAVLDDLQRSDPEHRFLQDVARLELVRAAAHDLEGDWELALSASRRAAEAGGGTLLPLVHEAILTQRRSPGTDAERTAWERVLEASTTALDAEGAAVDFERLLLQLMARANLGRLEEDEPGFLGIFAGTREAEE